ncbi:MAG: DUF4202 domain-containing protein [Polyangiaceae bacterium]|nr:DUF4202 domain-containing protein [Polyangiaceae bacterium]
MSRFEAALAAFDRANAEDPERVLVAGVARPKQLVHAERLSAWVLRLDPQAPEAARLAARCQHLRRFEHPRSEFPEGRVGYLKWRTALGRFHAAAAREILERVGYDTETIEEVARINQKQGLRGPTNTQLIEDALCLVFLEYELRDFVAKHPRGKVLEVLSKTWKKMSSNGQAYAQSLALPNELAELVAEALTPLAAPDR